MVRIISTPVAALLACLLVGCEDNIGRLFDPDVGGGAGSSTGVAAMPVGGNALDPRPRVADVFPTGDGWPVNVPVVVVFTESLNQESVAPALGDPLVYVSLAGTDVPLPAQVDFLMGSTVVVIRPLTDLIAGQYEVVVDSEVRDVDGLRFGGSGPSIVATFIADGDSSENDGEILALLPQNNEADVPRETQIFAVFNKPAVTSSVTPTNFSVTTAAGATVTGALDFPLRIGPAVDGRVLRFTPAVALAGDTDIEITVDATISFPGVGSLDFNGRTPFGSFRTLAFEQALGVSVGNAVAGFPDQINIANMDTLVIDVDVPASALAGDTLAVRIYGLDPKTQVVDDVNFVELKQGLVAAGAQTVAVDFSGDLGSVANPRFADGPVTIAAQLQRGSRHTGYILSDSSNTPRLDVTPPDVSEVGPPMTGSGDIITDLEYLAFYGTATEQIGSASLTDGMSTVDLFASEAGGRFVMEPLFLGRRTSALGYSLTLTDDAGNMSMMALAGDILQRGVVTGAQAGTLTVEAYDEATLQALAGATVVLDPGIPTVPATGQILGVTGADGRAVFMGLVNPTYTVTLMLGGYQLRTLYDTGAAHVSLPLRPTTGDTGFLAGAALFAAQAGDSVLLGSNVIDDPRDEEIATSTSAPTSIPATAIRPGRPMMITAFAGTFEPSAKPTYDFYACLMCGLNGATPNPPAAPAVGTGVASQTLGLVPAAGALSNLLAPFPVDFAASLGLGAIVGTPTARIVTSFNGFGGQTLMGVGFSTLSAGASYDVDGSFSFLSLTTLAAYGPVSFVSTEATDALGNIARHRGLLDPFLGTVFNPLGTPGIPAITPPGGSFTSAPAVTYMDRLDRTAVAAGFAMTELTATGAAGRNWSLLIEDTNGAVGSTAVQFPDLSAVGTAGLVLGTWSIRVEDYLYLSTTFGLGDLLIEERFRQQVSYARAQPVAFVVN
jgi:hypothetical protein